MKNIFKLAIGSMIALFLVASVAQAVTTTTVTNRGQVITIRTLPDLATDVKDADMYQDFSIYPYRLGDAGKIVRFYDYSKQGGTASSTFKLLPEVPIPAHTLIRGGYAQTLTAIAPAIAYTNSMGIASATDIKATGTNWTTTGYSVIVPVTATASTWIEVSTNSYLYLTTGVNAITNGKIMVVLDCEIAP